MKLIFKKPVTEAVARPAGKLTFKTQTKVLKPQAAPEKPKSVSNLDALAKEDIDRSINCLVPWYLMASYLYYHRDTSLLSDAFYDRICFELDTNFTQIKHWHKPFVDRKQLKSGTGYSIRFDKMPVRIIIAANTMAHEYLGVPYPG